MGIRKRVLFKDEHLEKLERHLSHLFRNKVPYTIQSSGKGNDFQVIVSW